MNSPLICLASVWPHDHIYAEGGPLDVRIKIRHLPPHIKNWPTKKPLRISLYPLQEQPTNLTFLDINFDKHAGRYNCRQWRLTSIKPTLTTPAAFILEVRLKARYTRSVPHPIPLGQWRGICGYNDGWAKFTLHHQTLTRKPKEPEPSRIILPDKGRGKKRGESRIVSP